MNKEQSQRNILIDKYHELVKDMAVLVMEMEEWCESLQDSDNDTESSSREIKNMLYCFPYYVFKNVSEIKNKNRN